MHSPQPDVFHRSTTCQRRACNGLGIAGFVVSLTGVLFTCGLLAPLGLFLSSLAMFKRPRGLATAGLVIGLVGTLWLAAGGLVVTAGMAEAGEAQRLVRTTSALEQAAALVESNRQPDGALLDDRQGQMLIVDLQDGYGNALHYQRLPSGQFEVRSAGHDGLYHTADDVTNLQIQHPRFRWDD